MSEPAVVGIGQAGTDPVEVPDEQIRVCGHFDCGGPLGAPDPEMWVPGLLDPGSVARFAVVHPCYLCEMPSVVVWTATPGEDDVASLRGSTQSPAAPPPAIDYNEYDGTDIEAYRREAWRCQRSWLGRAAMVMARSALQALFRRYLRRDQWGLYNKEFEAMRTRAGDGWHAVGDGVRKRGNRWAHPEGGTEPPSRTEVNDALRRLDDVLRFTAAMERAGHLFPTSN